MTKTSYHGVEPKTQCCYNCKHFVRHYYMSGERWGLFYPVAQGHCVYPRIKNRYNDDLCGWFEPEERRSQFQGQP